MWNEGTLVGSKWFRNVLFKTLQWLPVALRIKPKLLPWPARLIPVSSPVIFPMLHLVPAAQATFQSLDMPLSFLPWHWLYLPRYTLLQYISGSSCQISAQMLPPQRPSANSPSHSLSYYPVLLSP